MKQIAVCGEYFSTNIGDQAIHASLLYLLKQLDAEVETISLDLSGRTSVQQEKAMQPRLQQRLSAWKSHPALNTLLIFANLMYQPLRLNRLSNSPWGRALKSADTLVIGGGQLLMDDSLNFPLKVSGVAKLARRYHIPYHFCACGVGKNWSPFGRQLFKPAILGAKSITLRDNLSASNLRHLLPEANPLITFDPAIWIAKVYPVSIKPGMEECIGVCVMNNDDYNARVLDNRYDNTAWMSAWLELIENLLTHHTHVLLFTSGDQADTIFAAELYKQSQKRGWNNVQLAPRPIDVPSLAGIMQSCQVIIAARLHAGIIANAYGIPTIGIIWDEKVRSYYDSTNRQDLCFPFTPQTIAAISNSSRGLMGSVIAESTLEAFRQRALESVRAIFNQDF